MCNRVSSVRSDVALDPAFLESSLGFTLNAENRSRDNRIKCIVLHYKFLRHFVFNNKSSSCIQEGKKNPESEGDSFYPEGKMSWPHSDLWPLKWVSTSWNWHILRERITILLWTTRLVQPTGRPSNYEQWHCLGSFLGFIQTTFSLVDSIFGKVKM